MKTSRTVAAAGRAFGDGVLVDLADALRAMRDGELVSVEGAPADDRLGMDLGTWSKLTGHAIVHTETGPARRWVIRKGVGSTGEEPARAIGSRIWLYTNFDCNLRCDYCCVRSSPATPRRALGLATVRRVVEEASALARVEAFFVTGGEPFLLPDIGEILTACTDVRPTTVLTNAMLFTGPRLERLRALPTTRLTLQISLDSPTAELHDLHRGRGSWDKAMRGIDTARGLGFRVRLAATVSAQVEEDRFREFLDKHAIPEDDRVIRRIALRGFAEEGVALAKTDLVPEVTISSAGVYWHPVGADDEDFLVTREISPLSAAIEAVRTHWEAERRFHDRLAEVFRCA